MSFLSVDAPADCWDFRGVIAVSDAVAKMQTLSEERAARVVSPMEDLADLEARENAEDLAAAHEALADGEVPVPWEEAKTRPPCPQPPPDNGASKRT